MAKTAFDPLHGHKRQPFPDFGERSTYLERLTIPDHAEAVEVLREEGCDWGAEPQLQEIWMRYGFAQEEHQKAMLFDLGEGDIEGWWECDEHHPDAIPFWKDGDG